MPLRRSQEEAPNHHGYEFPETSAGVGVTRYTALNNGTAVTWREAIDAIMSDEDAFANGLTAALQHSPHKAFFWETVPVTKATAASTPFEFILADAAPLARVRPEKNPFPLHIGGCGEGVAVFANLNSDATLVSPCHQEGIPATAYTHLAAFVRGAPPPQIRALWQAVGRAVADTLAAPSSGDGNGSSAQPLWVSTSGLGVYWLHVRLDERPKYYTHDPYKYYFDA
ncbi:hypothetical protein JKP88DRAFT_241395 [Tribonema minus]|uniref:Uncharacterized protein n=1 Tax=Tribonema minus TaxID=303371 RepID=A0A836CFF3_9STRA|nr:hypothetical protein JKP88DRAFT_241395 [Tribonema minus]